LCWWSKELIFNILKCPFGLAPKRAFFFEKKLRPPLTSPSQAAIKGQTMVDLPFFDGFNAFKWHSPSRNKPNVFKQFSP
jgi:hypothetical protein